MKQIEYITWRQDKITKQDKNEGRRMKSGIVAGDGDMKLKASYSYKGYEFKSQWCFKILFWKEPSICYCGMVLTQWFQWLALIPAEWRRQNEELKANCSYSDRLQWLLLQQLLRLTGTLCLLPPNGLPAAWHCTCLHHCKVLSRPQHNSNILI